ncbi:MAG: helix-turn-helix transcriptional regulator [Phycisphaerae bacterium]|nr:helix-turn-helix transcriptional regulator [Phycisphaerae bacterium]
MTETPKQLAAVLKVLAVATRVRIVRLLKARPLCVGALAARLNVTQGAVSQHLRIMRDAGLVVDDKRGCFVHYRLNEATLAAWRDAIDALLDADDASETQTKGHAPCAAATTKKTRRAAGSRKT